MAATPSGRTYHWIITLAWMASPTQRVIQTGNGTIDTSLGDTRQDLYKRVLAEASEEMGAPDSVTVTFFALEPNQLD